uniref:Uncharacterized protein n=1 Tax=Leersia perrieri TaxID=77586 RepID=A0A0D9VLC3_9ORYZ
MELTTLPASPPPPPPQDDFRFDGPAFTALPDASASADTGTNPFASASTAVVDGGAMDSNPFLATAAMTAPPSPNPFELHHHNSTSSPGAGADDPFDLFHHFTSAPASPARAAAIYAQFDGSAGGEGNGAIDDDDFQPRASYSTATSTVPFDWEEKPGKPKNAPATATAANAEAEADEAEFDFGVLLDKSVQVPELTAADELFDEGKIRPLKPPPGLLDGGGGSVASSPRSPMSKSPIWSPRRRGLIGSGADFDPFAAALAKSTKNPSPLGAGAKSATADDGTATSPKNPDSVTSPRSIPPATMINGGMKKKWRLSDMLLFRRSAAAKSRAGGGDISKEPIFKYSPVQHLGTTPAVKKATTENGDDVTARKHKKHSKKATAPAPAEVDGMASPHRQSVMGCVRLNPGLHRLAKGFNGSSLHFGHRRNARSVMNR